MGKEYIQPPVFTEAEFIPDGLPRLSLKDIGVTGLPTEELSRERGLTEHIDPAWRTQYVFDIDNTVSDHGGPLLASIGAATGIHVSRERFLEFGYTTLIPEWQTPEMKAIHDRVVRGDDAEHFPYVNDAYPGAPETLITLARSGNGFSYLTARPARLFAPTMRELTRNRIVLEMPALTEPASDSPMPIDGRVYFAPMTEASTGPWKTGVVTGWLTRMRESGWQGRMVVVDDRLEPFHHLMETHVLTGIALHGMFNETVNPHSGEIRVRSWDDLAAMFAKEHERLLTAMPHPYRTFTLDGDPDHVLILDKKEAGVGMKPDLSGIRHAAYVPIEAWRQSKRDVLRFADITNGAS